jgi:hypothetical protein
MVVERRNERDSMPLLGADARRRCSSLTVIRHAPRERLLNPFEKLTRRKKERVREKKNNGGKRENPFL